MKVELIDSMGSDLAIVNAARVSFAKESDYEWYEDGSPEGWWRLSEKDQKLINYLAKHGHWTPFAHSFLSYRIKAPIFVARQLVKHQVGLAWNEVSRRYVDDEPEFYVSEEWRAKAENVKQGSSDVIVIDDIVCDDFWYSSPKELVTRHSHDCLTVYQALLDKGICAEQARMVLPQNTMTEWIWSGSLAAFARVCKLRLDPHAQQETQEVAKQINQLVPQEFQHSWQALLNN